MGYEDEHVPVLLKEVLFWLHPKAGGRYVDCTLGTGKTALSILRQSDSPSYLLGIDRDPKGVIYRSLHFTNQCDKMSQGIESRISTFQGLTFTVDTLLTDAGLLLTGTPDLSVNAAIQYLQYADNCTIKGFCMSFPYQFGQGIFAGGDPMFVQLGWADSGVNSGSVNEVGDTGRINIPDPNYWYDMDVFVPCPDTAASKWKFQIVGLGGYVSMINAPAVLDEDDLDVTFHLKIQHTLPLLG